MKNSFVKKLDREDVGKIIKFVYGDQFELLNFENRSNKVNKYVVPNEPNSRWAYYDKEGKYLCVLVKDKKTNFITRVCLLEDRAIMLGYEEFNNNFHVSDRYLKAMFFTFGYSYRRFLHRQINEGFNFSL
ncbi:MAG TPA: hypothetical protein DCO89_00785 [Clostridiales bacterium]|nr:hypothetical protein [Clostridiales bacterium]